MSDGLGAMLMLPSGVSWRSRPTPPLDVTDSVYLAPAPSAKHQQIVIAGVTGGEPPTVNWSLKKGAENGRFVAVPSQSRHRFAGRRSGGEACYLPRLAS